MFISYTGLKGNAFPSENMENVSLQNVTISATVKTGRMCCCSPSKVVEAGLPEHVVKMFLEQ